MNIDSVLAALASAQLITTMSMEEARGRALARFGTLLDGRDAAALVLNALGQPIPGHVSHDFHFWTETDDVVAEFASAIRWVGGDHGGGEWARFAAREVGG